MSIEDFKEITTDNPGSILRYGGNDLKELMRMLNGQILVNRRPKIATQWHWLNNTLTIRNPADTFSYTFESGAITADRKIILPVLASDATLVLTAAANTFTENQTTNKSAQSGVTELIQQWTVADSVAGSKVEILNASATDAIFSPWFRSYNLDSVGPALYFYGYIGNALDTGGEAGIRFDVRKADNSAITTRPLFSFLNAGTEVFAIGQSTVGFGNNQIVNATAGSTLTGIVDANISAHTSTKITIADRALLPAPVAYDDEANIFTSTTGQEMRAIASELLKLYRPEAGLTDIDISYYWNDSLGNKTRYSVLRSTPTNVTDGLETSRFDIFLLTNGVFVRNLRLLNNGDLTILTTGTTGYAFLGTGLTGIRNFTWPDLSGKIATDTFTNIFTAQQKIQQGTFPQHVLYVPSAVVGNAMGIQLRAQQTGAAEVTFADFYGRADVLTAGLYEGSLRFRVAHAGVLHEPFQISAQGNVIHIVKAQAGVAETLNEWKVSDVNSYIRFINASPTDSRFLPMLRGRQVEDATLAAMSVEARCEVAHDTGAAPMCTFDARTHSDTAIVTRPLFDFRTAGTVLLRINAKGDVVQTILAQVGVAEVLHEWKVSDSAGYIRIRNQGGTGGLAPEFATYNVGATSGQPSFQTVHYIESTQDSGGVPIIKWDVKKSNETAISTRPLFVFNNLNVPVFIINPNSFDFSQKDILNARGVHLTPIITSNASRRYGEVGAPVAVASGHLACCVYSTYGIHATSSSPTEGPLTTISTSTTIGNQAGFKCESINTVRRNWNPRFLAKFAMFQTINQRFLFGPVASGASPPTGNNPLNAMSGFLFGVITTNPNFVILHNDATGDDMTIIDTGVVINTGVHTVEIEANITSGWRWRLDAGAWSSFITTNAPATSVGMQMHYMIETTEAVIKTVQHYIVTYSSDK